jgi:ABC-type amino acid transport substrate-binding protein
VIIESFWLNDQLVRSLVEGDIDATLQGSAEIRAALLDTPYGLDFDFVGPVVSADLLGNSVAIAMRKTDTALLSELNHALEQLMQNGEYQRILAPYRLNALHSCP